MTDWRTDIPGEYRNQIVTGDARELAKRIPDESLDLILTDPPYFVPVQTYVGTRKNGWSRRTLGDMSVLQTYFDVMFDVLCSKLKPSGSAYVFCDGQSYPIIYRSLFPHFKYVRPLIWDKVVSYNGYTWRHQHEIIAWCEGVGAQRIPTGDGDIIRCRGVLQKDRKHPAEKPWELLAKIIQKHGRDLIVFDPYCGSGSTVVACKYTFNDYVAFEIDPGIAEQARERVLNTQPPLLLEIPKQMEITL